VPARVCGFESLLRHQSPFSNVNLTDCRSHADIRALNLKATTGVEDDTSVCPSAGPLPVPASSPFQACHETVSRTAGPAIEVMNKLSSIPRLTALLYFWHAPECMSVTDKERGSFGLTPLDIFFTWTNTAMRSSVERNRCSPTLAQNDMLGTVSGGVPKWTDELGHRRA
jgi:hypothetical protein